MTIDHGLSRRGKLLANGPDQLHGLVDDLRRLAAEQSVCTGLLGMAAQINSVDAERLSNGLLGIDIRPPLAGFPS